MSQSSVNKRSITGEDIDFLSQLQETMNTQDTVCQADPRFWVIREERYEQAAPDDGIYFVYFHGSSFIGRVDIEDAIDGAVKAFEPSDECETVDEYLERFDLYLSGKKTLVSFGQSYNDSIKALIMDYASTFGCTVSFFTRKVAICPNTLFLTKASCENHIMCYGYNYNNPHSYAMTAYRSPEVEQLYDILHNVDFSELTSCR